MREDHHVGWDVLVPVLEPHPVLGAQPEELIHPHLPVQCVAEPGGAVSQERAVEPDKELPEVIGQGL